MSLLKRNVDEPGKRVFIFYSEIPGKDVKTQCLPPVKKQYADVIVPRVWYLLSQTLYHIMF